MLGTIAGASFFACIAFLASQASRFVCANVVPHEDGPPSSEPPVVALTIAAAAIGAILIVENAPPMQIGIAAVGVLALVACWCSDALCGIVPDAFTLVPLALLSVFGAVRGDWWILASAFALFLPLAAAAALSKGAGMGWGDAKMAAFAGALLGAPLALPALAVACVAAAVGYRVKRIQSGPIAFAPYIAAAVGIALPLGAVR